MPHRKFIRSQQQKKKERNETRRKTDGEEEGRRAAAEILKWNLFVSESVEYEMVVDPTQGEWKFPSFLMTGGLGRRNNIGRCWALPLFDFPNASRGPSWPAHPIKPNVIAFATAHVLTQLYRRVTLIRPAGDPAKEFSFLRKCTWCVSTIGFVDDLVFCFEMLPRSPTFVCSSLSTRDERACKTIVN